MKKVNDKATNRKKINWLKEIRIM